MPGIKEHICVGICTFKRPEMVARLLREVGQQQTGGWFDLSVVVVDNDVAESARSVVMEFARQSGIPTCYSVEAIPNIAMARNKVVSNASGNYLAFIDDDEFPVEDWLLNMFRTCRKYNVAGVLGPVLPHFDIEPPGWLTKGGFYDWPRHETGFVLGWQESRTGNVLLRRSILDGLDEVFRPQFGAGGEDQDFFRRLMSAGHQFIWCDEAPAYETVPPHRWKPRFLIKRALLRGRISFTHPKNRARNLIKAFVAFPLYLVALPFLFFAGQHLFMRYLVRMFDHGGRILALFRLNPVSERDH
jgi:succinoglycan biosynthesis protein ExoM